MLQAEQQQAFARILTTAAELKATDLHLTIGNPPTLRLDGKLMPLEDEEVMTPEILNSLVDGLLNEDQKKHFNTHKDVTISDTFQERIRYRMNVFLQKGFPALSLRFIPDFIPALDSLGLPDKVADIAKLTHGLVLVTGPFGSGKTTTIASIVQKINLERREHIVTIEDPIEYLFTNNKSVIEQREVGRDAESALTALELADREDVDVIVVSGMKIPEVIHKTIEISATNRLVLASIAADSIIHALQNIVASYPEEHRKHAQSMLSETLQAIIGQHLLARIGGGQVVVPEFLIPNTPARSVIREGAFEQLNNIMQTSRDQGMLAFDSTLASYVQSGIITPEEAKSFAQDPDQFENMTRP